MNLKKILKDHKKWLENSSEGKRADLRNANLHYADLSGSKLSYADLRGTDLRGSNLRGTDLSNTNLSSSNLYGTNLSCANLYGSNLSCADLRGTDLRGSNLSYADLRDTDLSNADLSNADLHDADLRGSNLYNSNLSYADLYGIKLNIGTRFYFPLCPNGCFTAYKKAQEKIVVLEIPADAKRSSATTYKCRANKAKVLRIENLDGSLAEEKFVASNYDKSFVYTVGETVTVKDFDENRWNECSNGIHFFISRDMAVEY